MKHIVLTVMLMTSITMNAQTDVPVFLQKNGYTKSMDNVFSCIEEGKLYKAIKEQEEIREKFAKDKNIDKYKVLSAESYLYPIWHVANSLFFNTKSGKEELKDQPLVQYDPWKAYYTLQQATHDATDKANVDAFFSQRKLNHSVANIKADIETNLIEETVNKGTEEAYDKLISTLYDYADLHSLETKRELIAFGKSIQSERVSDLQRYMDKYKLFNAQHFKAMEHRRDSIAFVQLEDNANACKHYLKSYPESEYYGQVTKLLHRYEFEGMVHSVSGCKAYLQEYPTSEYANQVKEMMVRYAFDDAKQARTADALGDFLDEYSHSEYHEAAKQKLKEILDNKYLSTQTTASELESFIRSRRYSSYVDYTPYKVFYANLRYLPTSAMMMDCRGLTGEVTFTTDDYEEVYVFDKLGLLVNHRHSRRGTNDTWEYDYNEKGEVWPSSKTDNRGKTTSYKTTFNTNGLITSITGNDGTQTTFSYTADNVLRTVSYSKNGKQTRIDTYDSEEHVIRSERNGVILAYEYNYQGDVVSMDKKRGNIVMDQTTYDYDYDSSGQYWCTMRQYNNGSLFLVKHRTFSLPSLKSTSSSSYDTIGSSYDLSAAIDDSDQKVYDAVEQMPSFPGGQGALMQWLSENVKYPVVAQENGVQGRVVVAFVVEKDGSITDVRVVRSIDPVLDQEAQRVMMSMPRWKPGTKNGSAVRVKYNVPVSFRLSLAE